MDDFETEGRAGAGVAIDAFGSLRGFFESDLGISEDEEDGCFLLEDLEDGAVSSGRGGGGTKVAELVPAWIACE